MSSNNPHNSLYNARFPLSNKYPPQWVLDNEMGPHPLWFTELLVEYLEFKPGMRVLDLGCGRAISSIFLATEFDVQVWATDLWISADDNFARIEDAGLGDSVFPIQADAHSLPYAANFFDAIISIDAYFYFGTDDLYLSYLSRFLRSDGKLGIAQPSILKESFDVLPPYVDVWSSDVVYAMHSVKWWRHHFEKSGLMSVDTAIAVENGWRLWLEWEKVRNGKGLTGYPSDAPALEADEGEFLGFMVLVAQRKGAASSMLYQHRTWS